MRSLKALCTGFLTLLLFGCAPLGVPPAAAQNPPAATPSYGQAELDRLLAPIALYPDALLSQILMAATYPLEVAEAANWSRDFPGLSGDAAVRAVWDRDWDPSVKSLVAFPNILQRMGDNPGWTRSLGNAFFAQEPYVLETVQQLRQRARIAGSLASDERQRVIEDGTHLRIEPVRPEIVYVPYYDPWSAYGPWRWPAYPPVAWAPWPGYVVARPGFVIVWGPAIRLSLGFFFAGFDWHRREVHVTNVYNYYVTRVAAVPGFGRATVRTLSPGRWQHDARHRRGIDYADPAPARRIAVAVAPAEPAAGNERRDPDGYRDRERGREREREREREPKTIEHERHAPAARVNVAPAMVAAPVVPAPPPAITVIHATPLPALSHPHRTPHHIPHTGSNADTAPKFGYPTSIRSITYEHQRKLAREAQEAQVANKPAAAPRQPAAHEKERKERRGEPEYRQQPGKRHPKPD